jgi:hypothetical protein
MKYFVRWLFCLAMTGGWAYVAVDKHRLCVAFVATAIDYSIVAGFAAMEDYFVVATGFITAGHLLHRRLEL